MSELETLFGRMTVGDLCTKASITVSTLMQRVLEPNHSVAPPPVAVKASAKRAASTKSSKGKDPRGGHLGTIGNLASPTQRQRFDDAILDVLRSAGSPLKIDEILRKLPFSNVSRDQVSRAMPRLREAGKITASGKTQARVYALVKN